LYLILEDKTDQYTAQLGIVPAKVEDLEGGYGEENDFSCRAQALGYVDLLDDATFIYHKGNASFQKLKESLVEKNTGVLRKRHPHYFDRVATFCNQNPLSEVRHRVLDKLVSGWGRERPQRVLHILHNGPHTPRQGDTLGGTELHVQDLIESVKEVAQWSLVPGKGCYYLTAHFPGGEREFILAPSATTLKSILNPEWFSLIHCHHSAWFDHHELSQALSAHGNYVVSFHDYVQVCPRFHFLTPEGRVCDKQECSTTCGYDPTYINQYRSDTKEILLGAKECICFSKDTQESIEGVLREKFKWTLISHGVQQAASVSPQKRAAPSQDKPFKVAFLGYIPRHKGGDLIRQVAGRVSIADDIGVKWHVIGKLLTGSIPGVIEHGEYAREELPQILKKIRPHVIAILSSCPETYSFTLDEAWCGGIPVVVTPLGAPAERVQNTGAGWVLKERSKDALLKQLEWIATHWEEYQDVSQKIAHTNLITVKEEGERYHKLYSQHLQDIQMEIEKLLDNLKSISIAAAPTPSVLAALLKKLVNNSIYLLDTLRIRGHIQQLAYRLLPSKIVNAVKSIR